MRIFLILLTLLSPLSAAHYAVGILAIFKDEAPYLREWLEFHRVVGVEHFWLYNNQSSDSFQEVLAPYIKKGIVELFDWDQETSATLNWNTIQCNCYMDGLKKAKNKARWVAILDVDEFLFPVVDNDLPTFLARFSSRYIGGIGVNWQLYGTSHVEKLTPNQLLTETLILKGATDYGENIQMKSIVRPAAVQACFNPHSFEYKPGFLQVTPHHTPFTGPLLTPVDVDLIRINHYWTRDENYLWNIKLARRGSWGEGEDGVVRRASCLNEVEDTLIFRFLPQLKAAFSKSSPP